jgi:type II secretory pathway pseudopilin PulG
MAAPSAPGMRSSPLHAEGAIRRSTQRGFTYLGLLFFIAVMGLALAATGTVASMERKREKEKELLFVGAQFRQAISRYYERSPGGLKQYPPNLEALLHDSRYPGAHRYLRKVYADPLTGKTDWGLVEGPGGTVMGVYSLSKTQPLKVGNFTEVDQAFEGKTTYADWKFVYIPPQFGAAAPFPASLAAPKN